MLWAKSSIYKDALLIGLKVSGWFFQLNLASLSFPLSLSISLSACEMSRLGKGFLLILTKVRSSSLSKVLEINTTKSSRSYWFIKPQLEQWLVYEWLPIMFFLLLFFASYFFYFSPLTFELFLHLYLKGITLSVAWFLTIVLEPASWCQVEANF